ncbi:MAG: class I SAM-dependent methyltransferase [Fibrobacteria bacterium]|nr:class I SAM-dependent methyltransferase [Fibrobacteria bacterium]
MWDSRYLKPGYAFGTIPNDFLKSEFLHIPKNGSVLCLAEGEGRNGVFLAEHGYSVTCVDQSSVGLQKAEKLAREHGVTIKTIVSDLSNFEFESEVWDGIVSIFAHVPAELRKQIHSRLIPSLKPEGVFILEAYTLRHLELEGTGGPPADKKDFFMSLRDIKQELTNLSFIMAQETERKISEGEFHHGKSAVVQVVAQKS